MKKQGEYGKYKYAGVLSILLLTGCVTGKDGHGYIDGHCVTCINNPITGEAYNYSKSSKDYQQSEQYKSDRRVVAQNIPYEEGRVRFSVRSNIDRAYLKVKREFGFKTRTEMLGYESYKKENLDYDEGFRYEAMPGLSYHMRTHTSHRYKGASLMHTIDIVLENNGSGTDVEITYWVQKPRSALRDYGNSLKARVIKALR